MNPAEYEKLARLDGAHWYYRGKRDIVRHWIERFVPLRTEDLLIDAGMGTGTWLCEMSSTCKVLGLDDHAESLAIAAPRLESAGGRSIQTGLSRIDLPDAVATVVTALDVIEHLEDDRGALREMIRITRPGGLVVVTVPAHRWLWSDWDDALHHLRRYERAGLLAVVSQPEVQVLRCAYFNSLVLPLVLLARSWRKLRPRPPGAERAEDRLPSAPINALLHALMVVPARWRWFQPPAGVSLLAVLRKK